MGERRRIYAPPEAFRDGGLLLEGERLRHVRAVLRLGPGDELAATDGVGAEYLLRIEHLGRERGRALVLSSTEPPRESALETIIAQALPKGERFSFVLEKAVELGVSGIRPLVSSRTVVARGGGTAAVARWHRMVEAAVAQSGRTRILPVHLVCTFEELLEDPAPPPVRVLLWERAPAGLREAIAGRAAPRSVLLAVGPEGGWSEQEVERARQAGFVLARLGPRTLRTDTAGIAALALLQSAWGDLG